MLLRSLLEMLRRSESVHDHLSFGARNRADRQTDLYIMTHYCLNLLTIATLLLLPLSSHRAESQTVVGEQVIRFSLTDLTGKTHHPNNYLGQTLGIFLTGHN